MQVYVFGNIDQEFDNLATKVAKKIKGVDFVFVRPNEDLPFAGHKHVIIMDTVAGIDRVTLFTEEDLDKIVSPKSTTVHDYDLGFQLKYLYKLGKLPKLDLIALPQSGQIDYSLLNHIINSLKP